MCGINGIYAYHTSAPPVDREELLRVRDHMFRRGPDGEGLWISNQRQIGFGHRRLAIIDLSPGGAQPMHSADGRYVITFNGEIYNYRELRKELEAKGRVFRSQSDTEVLLHLYAEQGKDMVHSLRGMYTFGIWDQSERTLFLARDPFGIKPLYYSDDGKTFRFASQVKALLAVGAIDTTAEPAGTIGFLLLGSVPEPYTLYRNIRSLPAGNFIIVRKGVVGAPQSFFDVRESLIVAQDAEGDRTQAQVQEVFANAVRDSVRAHLVADVPVGVFLSAGIDSGTITGLASELDGTNLHTLTLGFDEFRGTQNDEMPLARDVAQHYGTTHHQESISRADFEQLLPDILEVMDQPSIDGVNTYLVSRAAARSGMKVALSGLGGDELLGGYPSFRQVPRLVRALRWSSRFKKLGPKATALTRNWIGTFVSPKYAGLLEYGNTVGGAYLLRRSLFMPWELVDLLDPATAQEGLETLDLVNKLSATAASIRRPHAQIAALELAWYMRNQLLRDSDWAGMAHSLEIRVPFVDATLFHAIAPAITSSQPPSKEALASAPRHSLPTALLNRRKTGFVTPVVNWIGDAPDRGRRRGLRGWARRVMPFPLDSSPHEGALNAPPFPRSECTRSDMGVAPPKSKGRHVQASLVWGVYRLVNGLLHILERTFWPGHSPDRAERIVIFRIGHIGDITCALPAMRAVRRAYPRAHLTLLTSTGRVNSPGAEELLDGVDWIDQIHSYSADDISSIKGRWHLAMQLRSAKPDIWIHLSANLSGLGRELRDMAFARLVNPRWARGWCVDTLSVAAQAQSEYLDFPGEVDRSLGIIAHAGIPAGPVEFGLPRAVQVQAKVDTLLGAKCDNESQAWAAIAPGAKRSTNRWPAERFIEVGVFLATKGVNIVLLGGANDAEECTRIATAIGPLARSLAGQLSLAESCEVLRRCRIAVCVDSGVQHLAGAVGTPSVSLFSFWQMRGKWHPYGPHNVVIQKWVPCHTCLLDECPHGNRCMKAIQITDVIRYANFVLDRDRTDTRATTRHPSSRPASAIASLHGESA